MRHGTDGAAYLIVQRASLVAMDLAMAVEDFDPDAPVIAAADCAEALPALDRVDRIAVAFIERGPAEFAHSQLARKVSERGGRVVLTGREAEDALEPLGYPVLERPFSADQISDHLAGPGN